MEAYLVADHPAKGRKKYHLTLFAVTNDGYKNLMQLADLSNQEEAFYSKPTVTKSLLLAHARGLVVLTGCPSGPVSKLLLERGEREASVFVDMLREGFGDRLRAEVMSNGYDGSLNESVVRLARRSGLQLVLTHDAHYIGEDDRESYEKLMGMHRGPDFTSGRENLWMPNAKQALEMTKGLTNREFVEGLVGARRLADESCVDMERIRPAMPVVEHAEAILRVRVSDGLRTMGKGHDVLYLQRSGAELDVIAKMGMSSYFCVAADIVDWARKHGVGVGPGRGSAGGSLVAYALGITSIDPVRFGIGFERFLREDKKEPPDIDLDFDADHQDRVVAHVVKTYGAVPISAFGYYRHRNLMNDLCKIYGEEHRPNLMMLEGWEPEDIDPDGDLVVETYKRFIKTVRYIGKHPGGVAIIEEKDQWMVPKMYVHGKHQASFDLKSVEMIGALKVDLLGLDTVSLLARLARVTRETPPESYGDQKVWELFATGECDGVFQFESRGGQEVLRTIQPKNVEELAVCNALNRPAPLELGFVEKYAKREGQVYDRGLARFFGDTRGVPVYQDQVWKLCIEGAKMTRQEADGVIKVIKATTPQERDVLADHIRKIRELFAEKMVTNGRMKSIDKALRLFDAITGYGFNKAHAVAYAVVAYMTAWYKVHHPLHFCHAHLLVKEQSPQRRKFERMAVDMGVTLLNPHVNGSASYSLEKWEGDEAIRRGYLQINGIGPAAAEAIAAGAPYRNLTDFEERCDCNVKVLAALKENGALCWDEDEQVTIATNYMKRLRWMR
jgi:DNA polymerase-3 subunit alpha